MKIESRTSWCDISKGILILLVILGHTVPHALITNYASSFYMSAFFVLSGLLMKKSVRAGIFMGQKFCSLMIPYSVFSIAWVIFGYAKSFIVHEGYRLPRALLSIILPYTGSPDRNAYVYWFLLCLFLAQCIVALIVYSKPIIFRIIGGCIWLTFAIVGCVVKPYCSILYATAMATVFVMLGYVVANYTVFSPKFFGELPKNRLLILGMASGCLQMIGYWLNVHVLKQGLDFSSASFGFVPLFILSSFGGSLSLFSISALIGKLKPIEMIGSRSMTFYVLHFYAVSLTGFVIHRLVSWEPLAYGLIFVLTLLISAFAVWLYNLIGINKLFIKMIGMVKKA